MDNLPPPIQVTRGDSSSKSPSGDDSLVEFKVKNPFQKFFDWIKSLIKNEGINIKIKPLTAIAIAVALTGGGGIAGGIIVYFFPHSSPVLHRTVIYQGNLQKTSGGFILVLPNSDLYTLRPKPNTVINFQSLPVGQALVKGNLTKEDFVIEVSEIIPFNANPSEPLISPNSSNLPNPPDSSIPSASSDLPVLYSGLQWKATQKKLLTFTSGKRRIEQEGIYFESALTSQFPQDFINYYLQQLKDRSFKETLNSINPDGITITYAKDDLFLTFGIKNKYSGSGNKKQFTGYTAFIEHN